MRETRKNQKADLHSNKQCREKYDLLLNEGGNSRPSNMEIGDWTTGCGKKTFDK